MPRILAKDLLAPGIVRFWIEAPRIARKRRAGQFVIVRLREGGERIPLTIADADETRGAIALVVQAVGKTTRELNGLAAGDLILDVAGPLGCPACVDEGRHVVFVAGGVGAAVVLPIARAVHAAGRHVTVLQGARTGSLILLEPELRSASDAYHVTTDDGTCGVQGIVTNVLGDVIRASSPAVDRVVAAGPVPMMRAVCEVTRGIGVRTDVSLNPIMIDGTGMCGGCRVSVAGAIRFACVDGPEFDAPPGELRRTRGAAHELLCVRTAVGCSQARLCVRPRCANGSHSARERRCRRSLRRRGAVRSTRWRPASRWRWRSRKRHAASSAGTSRAWPGVQSASTFRRSSNNWQTAIWKALTAPSSHATCCRRSVAASARRNCNVSTAARLACDSNRWRSDDSSALWATRWPAWQRLRRWSMPRQVATAWQSSGRVPAGLTAAADLARLGHAVTVFEALHKPGGVLAYGIPGFRLPKAVLDREIARLEALGVEIRVDQVIGQTYSIEELLGECGYEAVFIGTGAGLPHFPDIPGVNLIGVYSANELLTRVNLMGADRFPAADTPPVHGRSVAVVGGGNTAMDAVRTAVRLGAERAVLVYRRSREEMPARREEVEHAQQEGVEFVYLASPIALRGDAQMRLCAMLCRRMELADPDASGRRSVQAVPGSDFELAVDTVVFAIGQQPNRLLQASGTDLPTTARGYIVADPATGATSHPQVFAGGDVVTGSATVISAMGAGRRAAAAIHARLGAPLAQP